MKDHTTHFACKEIMDRDGGKAECCICSGHNCKKDKQIEKDWVKEFYEKFTLGGLTGVIYLNTTDSFKIRNFIKDLLAKQKSELKSKFETLAGEYYMEEPKGKFRIIIEDLPKFRSRIEEL